LKRYVFCFEDYPLGQIQFDEEKGIGNFTYVVVPDAWLFIKTVKPSTVIMLLEEIREDAKGIKTIGEFKKYINSNFGNFHFVPLKGYE